MQDLDPIAKNNAQNNSQYNAQGNPKKNRDPSGSTPHLTVKNYAQQIYSLGVDKDAARLSLLNFLIHFYDPQSILDDKVFENFYQQAIGFSFWQQNWQHLCAQVQACAMQVAKKNRESQIPKEWLNGEFLQPVKIASEQNLSALIYKYLERILNPAAQFKVLKASEEYWIAIILDENKKLSVKLFTDTFILKNSELVPAGQDFHIYYNSDLLLQENVYQHISLGNFASARFRITDRGVIGRVLRGYTFQKYEDLTGGALSQYASVFYPFKKIEQLYINLKTDPFYNEMIQTLEQATDYLQKSDIDVSRPDRSKLARTYAHVNATLQRAKQAQAAIFANDRMLSLLISNLEKSLALKNLYESPQTSHQIMDV